jgi:sugar lactone lactonase YvrE/mono/diheme cytochrome c family protein
MEMVMNSRPWHLFTVCLLGILTAFNVSGFASTAHASGGPHAGTGTLSGTVAAGQSFTAARVYAKNIDKNILYMVYTKAGEYNAINLMPGAYQVWAEKGEMVSPKEMLRIQVGNNAIVDLTIKNGQPYELTQRNRAKPGVPQVTYDEMYPDGPGKKKAEATCIACHGQTFLPRFHMNADGWDAMIGMMLDPEAVTKSGTQRGAMITGDASVPSITPEERAILAKYLADNFGPDSPDRILKVDVEYPLDEDALSKAMYVEYLIPLPPGADLSKSGRMTAYNHRLVDPKMDNDGNIWVTNGEIGVSMLDPRTGQYSHYPYPERGIFGHGPAIDSEGYVFWAEFSGEHLGRLDPKTGKMDRFLIDESRTIRDIQGHTPHVDSKGNVFFTVINGNKIAKWDRKTERVSLFDALTPNSFPYGIDMDKEDNVYFAQLWGCNVGKLDTKSETMTEYPALAQPCAMNRLTVDSKGIVWYSLVRPGLLGKLNPETGEQKEYTILEAPAGSKIATAAPYGIMHDPDDNIWFGDSGLGATLIKFNPVTEKFTYYPEPRIADNPNIDISREGAVIYTSRSSQQPAIGILFPDVSKMTTYATYKFKD